ncbi:hypothetical protein J437_LFUL015468 [Ladona fulva]|uniref:Reverse transcriptase domain-containing protein n=1 Tax=Ladona fulva TaxID=123851 RepID=A0A8K0KNQ8_LADFU|nr:hypothetical protein J437_LFUL015468 [Ladona fulva]
MGSPLSPAMANLYMENFENKTLSSAPLQPKVFHRYFDDTFVIWPHELCVFHSRDERSTARFNRFSSLYIASSSQVLLRCLREFFCPN